MKKLLVGLMGFLLMFSLSATAYAEGPYLGFRIGTAVLSDSDITDSGITVELESEVGYGLGVALGYGFSNNFRIEGEVAYQSNDVDKLGFGSVALSVDGDTTSLTFLLNGYYDFVNRSPITPFITAGIGYSQIELNDFTLTGSGIPNISEDDSVMAYQFGLGLGYAASETITIDCGYRYFATADLEFDTAEAEYASHNFYLGLRFAF